MVKKRRAFSIKLENTILYKSARTCCVCREMGKPVEIHHIDQDPSNNIEENLVAICRNCHDEAHTIHTMSKNLSAPRLMDMKNKWEDEVKCKSSAAMLPSSSSSSISQPIWTYINHQKIPDIIKSFDLDFDSSLSKTLIECKVIDEYCIPVVKKENKDLEYFTVYNYMESWSEAQRFHKLYTMAVDDLIVKSNPVDIGAIWSKREINNLVVSGSICFCMRGFYFKSGEVHSGEENRFVYTRSKNIEIRLYMNTRHMYGNSALYANFTGHKFCSILMLVKNIGTEDGKLILDVTPLAMGVGFIPDDAPRCSKYGFRKYKY